MDMLKKKNTIHNIISKISTEYVKKNNKVYTSSENDRKVGIGSNILLKKEKSSYKYNQYNAGDLYISKSKKKINYKKIEKGIIEKEKEKAIFSEYDKRRIKRNSVLLKNPISWSLLQVTEKDRKLLYKEPKKIYTFFIDIKKLSKTIPDNIIKHGEIINQIIQDSNTILAESIKISSIKNISFADIPPSVLRECTSMINILQNINKICIPKSILLSRLYKDICWNITYINHISKEISYLDKKTVTNTYNIMYKMNRLCITYIHKYNASLDIKMQSIYTTSIWYQSKEYLAYKKNTVQKVYGMHNILYMYTKQMILQRKIQDLLKNRIVCYYTPYITNMSKQQIRCGSNVELQDLISEGIQGIREAIDRYQLGHGARFLTFAYWWIHRYMTKMSTKRNKFLKNSNKKKTQKTLSIQITKLYNEIKDKKKNDTKIRILQHKLRLIRKKDIINILHNAYNKEYVLLCLLYGIEPYNRHNIKKMSDVFEIAPIVLIRIINNIHSNIQKIDS